MTDNLEPPAGPSHHAEGGIPDRLATREEEQMTIDHLVALKNDITDQLPSAEVAYHAELNDASGAFMELDFDLGHQVEPGKVYDSIDIWYESDLSPMADLPGLFQQRRVGVTLTTEKGVPLKDGYLHIDDKTVLLDQAGSVIPTEKENDRRQRMHAIMATYPDDMEAQQRAIFEMIVETQQELLPGEVGMPTTEQLQLIEHCIAEFRGQREA